MNKHVISVPDDDWQAELDRAVGPGPGSKKLNMRLTDEEFAYVHYGRTRERPVSWRNLVKLFSQRFGWGSRETIYERYQRALEERDD